MLHVLLVRKPNHLPGLDQIRQNANVNGYYDAVYFGLVIPPSVLSGPGSRKFSGQFRIDIFRTHPTQFQLVEDAFLNHAVGGGNAAVANNLFGASQQLDGNSSDIHGCENDEDGGCDDGAHKE
ncbi:hypothetical protein ACKVWC_000012 [Pyricularia oryzae]